MPKTVINMNSEFRSDVRGVPIFNWALDLDDKAREQAEMLACLPYVYHHVALMPDAHAGIGMPVGGVMATDRVVVPAAVGVDIGCGMISYRTNLSASAARRAGLIQKMVDDVYAHVPVGYAHHDEVQALVAPTPPSDGYIPTLLTKHGKHWIDKQVGTLGGGNHFIEFQYDSEDRLYFTVHTGSRGLGNKVARYHIEIAQVLNRRWHSAVPGDMAFLPVGTQECQDYLRDMRYCMEFAECNRMAIAHEVIRVVRRAHPHLRAHEDVVQVANIHHNYAVQEHHYGKDVWIHRKGATLARKGVIGIIPGDQGSPTFIVEGSGNRESFDSCAHGGGRVLGRKEAIRIGDLEAEIAKLEAMGIIHSLRGKDDLQEAPFAYKDISVVMAQQSDLVNIKTQLHPMGVVKGRENCD